ncbi:hypothetical protein G6F59_016298 [Rhizopus arrhizus]|nr:hypothetical protein G6F59_016298 [Rhizopus arrhizus]
MLDGSRSVFGPEPYTDVLAERLARFDIHPSAPLWGEGELRSTDAARELELAALDDEESKALRAGLEDARLKQERRALRLRPALLQHVWLADDVLDVLATDHAPHTWEEKQKPYAQAPSGLPLVH